MRASMLIRAATLAGAALLLCGATTNWIGTVVETGTSHRLGNPDARVKLVEYVSYTCSYCADFAREGEGPLQLAYIAPGTVNVEIRHLIRDDIDLTAALLAHCGPARKFLQNHSAFMLGQDNWIEPLDRATASQKVRWERPGAAGRRAIAADFGFYAIMERRGYGRAETDRCLNDEALANRLTEDSDRDWALPGIEGTPSFSINGEVLPDTTTWHGLSRRLDEIIRSSGA